MRNLFKSFFKSRFPYTSLIEINIHKQAIIHNYEAFKKYGTEVCPVIKSNAYGHGIVNIAEILSPQNPIFFIVDSYFEAIQLRNNGIKEKILIIGYTPINDIIFSNLENIHFTITSLDSLIELSAKLNKKEKAKIHLKIDTGMSRQGIMYYETEHAIKVISENENIELEGIMTHLADAESFDSKINREQIKRWAESREYAFRIFPNIKYVHPSNTSGHVYAKEMGANMSRLGLGLYGYADNNKIEEELNLEPALEMNTIITGMKIVNEGDTIGYNGTFTAKEKMKIATIPVGYREGLDRRLSNKGFVKINDNYAPIIGRISMNITCIDITNIQNIYIGTKVNVISKKREDKNSIINIAHLAETIPYEIFVGIPDYLKRNII